MKPGTWNVWQAMRRRCEGKITNCAKYYADRGITVCNRWQIYANFLADMGERPAGHVLDRIDNNKGYEPGNCRWATPKESSINRRYVRLIEWNGKTQCAADWERELGVGHGVISMRLRRGWDVARAMSAPVDVRFANRRRAPGEISRFNSTSTETQ